MLSGKPWFFLALLLWATASPGQDNIGLGGAPLGERTTNLKLRLQLDRTTIHVCEPVYICVTADKFASKIEPNIHITCKAQDALDLGPMEKQWLCSDLSKTPVRMTVLLSQVVQGESNRYLFENPGQYEIMVKIGPDHTPLMLNVLAGTPDDQQAFADLGAKDFTALLTEEFDDDSPPERLETCKVVARKHPDSTAAAYCRSYEAIALFKQNFRAHQRQGGPAVWAPVALQLQKMFPAHQDDFFGEKVGFYLAYAQGLCGDLVALTHTIDQFKTHFSPWGDRLFLMKAEVAEHLVKPEIRPTQPKDRTTQPSH